MSHYYSVYTGVVFTPKFAELTSEELDQNLEKLKASGLMFPLGMCS